MAVPGSAVDCAPVRHLHAASVAVLDVGAEGELSSAACGQFTILGENEADDRSAATGRPVSSHPT